MQFLTVAGYLTGAVLLAPAAAFSGEDLKVPGESPLYFCTGDHNRDIFRISKVDISPNPPQAGQDLVITCTGTVGETITEDAYVRVDVKLGLIKLISTTLDLCEQLGKYDIKCPITAGNVTWVKTVKLPKEIPPAKFSIVADVYNGDDESITCLKGIADFMPKNAFDFDDEL